MGNEMEDEWVIKWSNEMEDVWAMKWRTYGR